MAVYGNVRSMPVSEILQWIGGNGKGGLLRLEQDKVSTKIFFQDGNVVGCSSDDPPRLLGQFLIYRGVITEDMLRDAMALHEGTGESLPDVLIDRDLITRDDLRREIAAKAEETILSLFEWSNAVFWYREGMLPEKKAILLDLDVQFLLLEGMKRLDEAERLSHVFHRPGLVCWKTPEEPLPEVFESWPTRQVYLAADGRRSVEEIILHVHGTEFLVKRNLHDLAQKGLIDIGTAEEREAQAAGAATSTEAAEKQATPPRAEEDPDTDGPVCEEDVVAIDEAVEAHLQLAREHLSRSDHEAALDQIEEAYEFNPAHPSVSLLRSESETALVGDYLREGLRPDKLPVLVQSRESLAGIETTPAQDYLLDLADGTWSIRSLLSIAPMRSVDVLKALNGLLMRGLIELRSPETHEAKV